MAPESALIVVLDGVEDPHNLGAITVFVQLHAAGAGAVVIAERRVGRVEPTWIPGQGCGGGIGSTAAHRPRREYQSGSAFPERHGLFPSTASTSAVRVTNYDQGLLARNVQVVVMGERRERDCTILVRKELRCPGLPDPDGGQDRVAECIGRHGRGVVFAVLAIQSCRCQADVSS